MPATPQDLDGCTSLSNFKRQLKMYPFCQHFSLRFPMCFFVQRQISDVTKSVTKVLYTVNGRHYFCVLDLSFWKLNFALWFTFLFLNISKCLVTLRAIWTDIILILFFIFIRLIVYKVFVKKNISLHYCTDQLRLCEIAFPPQVVVHGGNGGQAVVWIHQHMDEAVQCGSKETCTQIMPHISQVNPILKTYLRSYK